MLAISSKGGEALPPRGLMFAAGRLASPLAAQITVHLTALCQENNKATKEVLKLEETHSCSTVCLYCVWLI